jgi:hypothetical protein
MLPRLQLYEDKDESKRLHCGIALKQRPILFGLSERELEAYRQLPVSFKITVRYRLQP